MSAFSDADQLDKLDSDKQQDVGMIVQTEEAGSQHEIAVSPLALPSLNPDTTGRRADAAAHATDALMKDTHLAKHLKSGMRRLDWGAYHAVKEDAVSFNSLTMVCCRLCLCVRLCIKWSCRRCC